MFYIYYIVLKGLSANVAHARHGVDIACSGCVAPCTGKFICNRCFWKRRTFATNQIITLCE